MVKGTLVLKSDIGLHARPSVRITEIARANAATTITVENPETGMKVDAKSLLSLLSLVVEGGKSLNLVVQGGDEESVYRAIADVIENFTVD